MKLGETIDSIYSLTLNLTERLQGSEYPLAESAILLTMEDGSFQWVNYGARVENTAELEFFDLPKSDYFTLNTYLKSKLGSKIRFTLSNDAENPWTESSFLNNGSYFYATITGITDQGEEDFSVSKQLYSIKIQISYTGLNATDVPNTLDSSLLDVCIEVDTVLANYTVSNYSALTAISNPVGGSVGFTTSDRKVYIYDLSRSLWQFQKTIAPDSADLGFVNGVFYWSAFADISAGSPGNTLMALYKAGLINRETITFPNSGLDPSKGPGVETLEGFSFAIFNDEKFSSYVNTHKINLYGALVKQKFYDRTNARMVLNRTGGNYNNSFDYHNYTFQIEPEILKGGKSYPDTTYSKSANPNVASEMIGKPVISTIGRWKKGEIQASNFTLKEQKFPNGRRFLSRVAYNAGLKRVTVNIGTSEFLKLIDYAATTDYPGTNPVKYLYLQIVSQNEQPDINKIIRIDTIAANGSNTDLTLATSYAKDPDGSAVFQVFMSVVELTIDDDKCIGFRTPNYIISAANGVTNIPMQLYAKINDTVEQIPDSYYKVLGSDENKLTLNGDNLDIDNFGTVSLKEDVEIDRIDSNDVKRILCPADPSTFDFGFIPDGLLSPKLKSFAGADPYPNPYGVYGVQSSDRITIAWGRQYTADLGRLIGAGDKIIVSRFRYANMKDGLDRAKLLDVTKFTISDYTKTYYVDTGMDPAFVYLYQIQYVDSSDSPISRVYAFEASRTGLNGGYKLDVSANTNVNLKVIGSMSVTGLEATLIWNKIPGQRQVKIFRDGVLIVTLDTTTGTYLNATAYQVPFSVEVLREWYIQVSNSNVGTNNDRWYIEDGYTMSDLWELQLNTDPTDSRKYIELLDNDVSESQRGYKVTTFTNGTGIPAAGSVFTWMLRLNHTSFPDLSNARDVRLLSDFVVRSFYDTHTQQPIFIQLRGIRSDGTSIVLQQYTGGGSGLQGKELSQGAFLQFVNLPTNKGGDDANYNTENQSSNTDGKYTGKDMWRLPDWLFEDEAQEWNKIEYLMFAVTNSTFIIPAAVDYTQKGYKIGLGALSGVIHPFTSVNKDHYYIQYVKEFEEGIDTPQFGRIDGGVIDDSTGFFTGTPNLIIERGRHVLNYIVYKMLGYKPLYIGTEMKSRDNWIVRYQSKDAIDPMSMLDLLCKNFWCCMVISPDDKIYARTLNLDEPRVNTVLTIDQTNIVKDSVTRPVFRKQSEIYQQFKFKTNYEPSEAVVAADPNEAKIKNRSYTEEIVVGWDLQKGTKISGGFSRKQLDTYGNIIDNIDEGDEKKLYELCKTSSLLYTTGGKINQFGYDKDQLLEFFYRPTVEDPKTGQMIEDELPNLNTLHGPMIKSPMRTIQDRIAMEVKFRVLNGWKFSLRMPLKYVIYSSDVAGISDEFSTPDYKLKKMDKVNFNHPFYTDGSNIQCLISNIEPEFYRGTVVITLYAPKPPGQTPGYIDHIWDASFGSRNSSDYVFKNNDNGLTNELGTFADAGFGARNIANFKFPDGTLADSEGEGSGQL